MKTFIFQIEIYQNEKNAMLDRKNSILKYKKKLNMKTTFHSIDLTTSVHLGSRLLAANQIPNFVLTYS